MTNGEALVLDAMDRIRKQGECGMCGGPFARHRVIDAYRGMIIAGEPLDSTAYWFGTEPQLVLAEIEALDRLMKDFRNAKRRRRRAGE